MVMLYNPSY